MKNSMVMIKNSQAEKYAPTENQKKATAIIGISKVVELLLDKGSLTLSEREFMQQALHGIPLLAESIE